MMHQPCPKITSSNIVVEKKRGELSPLLEKKMTPVER
jgi:hypothetical protein